MAEEQKKVCNCGAGVCGGCGCGWHGGWLKIVRCIFALVVLVVVFMLGVKIGELRGVLEAGRGYRMMGGYGRVLQNGGPMMGASSTAPAGGVY